MNHEENSPDIFANIFFFLAFEKRSANYIRWHILLLNGDRKSIVAFSKSYLMIANLWNAKLSCCSVCWASFPISRQIILDLAIQHYKTGVGSILFTFELTTLTISVKSFLLFIVKAIAPPIAFTYLLSLLSTVRLVRSSSVQINLTNHRH